MTNRARVDALHDELFALVEKAQGQAFISDGWCGAKNEAEFFAWLRDRQDWHRRTGAQIRQFFKKHGDAHRANFALTPTPAEGSSKGTQDE